LDGHQEGGTQATGVRTRHAQAISSVIVSHDDHRMIAVNGGYYFVVEVEQLQPTAFPVVI